MAAIATARREFIVAANVEVAHATTIAVASKAKENAGQVKGDIGKEEEDEIDGEF